MLSENQLTVLIALHNHDEESDGALTGPQLSHLCPRRSNPSGWGQRILRRLTELGLARELPETGFNGSRCYTITPEGVRLCRDHPNRLTTTVLFIEQDR